MSISFGRAAARTTNPGLAALALTLGTVAVAFGALSFPFHELNQAAGINGFPYAPGNALVALASGAVGALIALLRPRMSIGWLMLAAAMLSGIDALAGEYGPYAYWSTAAALTSSGIWASWLASWTWVVAGNLTHLAILVFPTGKLLSARWRIVVWAGAASTLLLVSAFALPPGPLYWTSIPNPAGVEWAAGLVPASRALFVLNLVVTTGAVALSTVVRLWRARGVERLQLKWFVYAFSIQAVIWSSASIADVVSDGRALRSSPVIAVIGVSLVWGSIGISILRYRLFDIDVIINRTLVYGVVTSLLAGTFAALSVITQRLTLAVTGQESQAAVVLAALIVTALFQPLRSVVQHFIDRRFYRSKYDASRTLERFASQVRDEVELERLTTNLVAVVQDAMQPAHASLWLRPTANQNGPR